jgi:hypothetical protein
MSCFDRTSCSICPGRWRHCFDRSCCHFESRCSCPARRWNCSWSNSKCSSMSSCSSHSCRPFASWTDPKLHHDLPRNRRRPLPHMPQSNTFSFGLLGLLVSPTGRLSRNSRSAENLRSRRARAGQVTDADSRNVARDKQVSSDNALSGFMCKVHLRTSGALQPAKCAAFGVNRRELSKRKYCPFLSARRQSEWWHQYS